MAHRDTVPGEHIGTANAGEFEQLRRLNGAGSEDHFAPRLEGLARACAFNVDTRGGGGRDVARALARVA